MLNGLQHIIWLSLKAKQIFILWMSILSVWNYWKLIRFISDKYGKAIKRKNCDFNEKNIEGVCHFDVGSEFKINAKAENAMMQINAVSDFL